MILLQQSAIDVWVPQVLWFVMVLFAFGAGMVLGALRPKERLADIRERAGIVSHDIAATADRHRSQPSTAVNKQTIVEDLEHFSRLVGALEESE